MATEPDAHKVKPLADALYAWAEPSEIAGCTRAFVLQDAITQATKAETIIWLASLAERYGFKAP